MFLSCDPHGPARVIPLKTLVRAGRVDVSRYRKSWPALQSRGFVAELKEKQKVKKFAFFDELWVSCSDSKKTLLRDIFLDYRIFWWFSCVRASMTSYLVWNKIFGIFKILWSYDKMPIVWVWSGKWSALGHDAQRPVHSVRTSWPRTKYFSVRPSHSVNKYISSHQLEFKKN